MHDRTDRNDRTDRDERNDRAKRATREGHQLDFEFAGQRPPSVASAELAAARARRAAADGPARAAPQRGGRSLGAPVGGGDGRSPPQHSVGARPTAPLPQEGTERRSLSRHSHDCSAPQGAPPRVGDCGSRVPTAIQAPAPIPETVTQAAHEELTAALELTLRARAQAPLRLTITDNRRTMVSLRKHKRTNLIEARVHHMFLHADASVWRALGDYLCSGERAAASCIANYIEQHRQHIRRPKRRPLALATAGQHHDLGEICRSVNERYFEGKLQVNISWSREAAGRPSKGRRSIKLGSYTPRDRLIRVHPALDAASVPRYFVEYIVYHEMLHHVLPPKARNGRRELHGRTFLAREREFRDYDAALRWERKNLKKLLQKRAQRAAFVRR